MTQDLIKTFTGQELLEQNDQYIAEKRRTKRWGKWKLKLSNYTLRHDGGYEVDLEDMNNSAGVLDWVLQVHSKTMPPEDVHDLMTAIVDLVNPQANLCSHGHDKQASAKQLVNTFMKYNPEEVAEVEQPLTYWYCDQCHKRIDDVEKGYVVWRQTADLLYHDFRIIHQRICDERSSFPCSMPLGKFLGVDGLSYLSSMLSLGPMMVRPGDSSRQLIADMDNFVDFMRRVQIPHYEQARRKFSSEAAADYFEGSNESRPYYQDALKKIIEIG